MLAPLPGALIVTQLFGSMRGGAAEAYTAVHDGVTYRCVGHAGVDFAAASGTPVSAMKPGTVRFYGPAWGFPDDGYSAALGLHAVVTLPSGEAHWYAHLSQAVAQDGSTVFGGQQIALSGASGNATGAHLHVAVRPPSPDYADHFDGFVNFTDHFDHSVALDNSAV